MRLTGDWTRPAAERLAIQTSPCPITGCFYWMGAVKGGYGSLRVNGKHTQAHRLAWELKNGPIPAGLVIDHLCKNPICVNPDHMEPVTERENILRSNGRAAINARKTHCTAGHPFDTKNTGTSLWRGMPRRYCRECIRIRSIEKRLKLRAAILGEKGNHESV